LYFYIKFVTDPNCVVISLFYANKYFILQFANYVFSG